MNITEFIEKENFRHDKVLKTVDFCKGFEDYVYHVTDNKIFCCNESFPECKLTLRKFSDKYSKYKLSRYYMNSDDVLAIVYLFEIGFELVLFCTEPLIALESISDGKCNIIEKRVTSKTVVCNIN